MATVGTHTSPSITASMLYDLVMCPHRVVMDLFANPAERDPVSPFVQLLWDRGAAHEQQVIAGIGEPFLWFDRWIETGNLAIRQRILDYNEDDCRATRVLLDGTRRLPLGVQ